jgi:hypothetical protein
MQKTPYTYKNETIIKTAFSAFGKPYILAHVAAGEEIAGSGTRYVNECYRVIHMFDGNRHSKAFKTLAEAVAEFEQWTKPIIEQTA